LVLKQPKPPNINDREKVDHTIYPHFHPIAQLFYSIAEQSKVLPHFTVSASPNPSALNAASSHYILGYPDNPVSIRLLNYSIGSQNRYFRSPLLPLLDLSIARLQLTARAEVYLPIPRTLQVDLRYLISTLGSVSLLSGNQVLLKCGTY
jgi:hypothetical protein